MTATVMTADDVRRALTRIAHEIIERDKGADDVALVGIADRGDDLARRLAAEIARIEGREVPVGVLDITFYRDDIGLRAEAPEVHETRIGFDVTRQGRRPGRRRAVHGPHDPLGDGRADGPRAAAQDPARRARRPRATASCRSGPTSSARTCPRAAATTSASRSQEVDGADAVTVRRAEDGRERGGGADERTSAVDARPDRRRRHPDPGHRRARSARSGRRVIKKVPALRGPHRRQLLPRELDAHADQLRARRQAAVGRRDQLQRRRLQRREGRVAEGHRAHAAGDGRRRDRRSGTPRAGPRCSSPGGSTATC